MPRARVRRGSIKKQGWRFEPSFCRPEVVECSQPSEATETYLQSMQSSWFEDMIKQPVLYAYAPPKPSATNSTSAGLSTHDRLFGIELPPVVARRRRSAEDSCDRPRWSPRYCLRPPSVDDFTRTHRNIHGDNEPTLRSTPPDDFNEPRTTILGPHPQPPLCCKPRPDAPLFNEKFERSRYNIIGPQSPTPLRFPVRKDDFINSSRRLFGPATSIPLRFPRRTTDFDDSHRNLFGAHPPHCTGRPSLRPYENTFEDLGFGITVRTARTVTLPPPAARQNINVFSTTEQSRTPPRFQPRPEYFFDRTNHHLFGRETPLFRSPQCRNHGMNTFNTIFGSQASTNKTGKRIFAENPEDTYDTIFGSGEPLYTAQCVEKEDDTFQNVFGIKRQAEIPLCDG